VIDPEHGSLMETLSCGLPDRVVIGITGAKKKKDSRKIAARMIARTLLRFRKNNFSPSVTNC
jgi:hypothetical protein